MNSPLTAEAAAYRVLRKDLIEQHGLGEEDQVLDTLDGQTDVMDQLAAMLRKANEYGRWIETNDLQIEELNNRNRALASKALKLRRIVVYFLGLIGRKRIDAPDFSVTLVNGRPALVGDCDPEQLPDKYVRIKREANRATIMDALKNGEVVEGYSISNGSPHLRNL